MSYNDRNIQWNPPSTTGYTVGSGATLTLTSDGHGYKFGYNNSQNDKTLKNIPLYDPVSRLMYDGADVEVTIYFYVPTSSALAVRLFLSYNILGDGDDFETGGVTSIGETIALNSVTANTLQSYTFITKMSGSADDTMLKMNFERLGSAGFDTYTGDFFLVGFIMKRA